jgi:ABC-type uncharacterized transport system permease subunit
LNDFGCFQTDNSDGTLACVVKLAIKVFTQTFNCFLGVARGSRVTGKIVGFLGSL